MSSLSALRHHKYGQHFSRVSSILGRSPRLILPIHAPERQEEGGAETLEMVERIRTDAVEAKGNLILAKLFQIDQAMPNVPDAGQCSQH